MLYRLLARGTVPIESLHVRRSRGAGMPAGEANEVVGALGSHWPEIVAALVGLIILGMAVAGRTVGNGKVQLQLSDITIAAIGVILVLLLTGRVSKFGISDKGLNIEVADAIRSAANKKVDRHVSPLPTPIPLETVSPEAKGAVDRIPSLIQQQASAISFNLSRGSYAGSAIDEYLTKLTPHSFFKFVVIFTQDNHLFGIIDARKLLRTLQDPNSGWRSDEFAARINSGSPADQTRLATFPGIVPADKSIRPDTDKFDALEKMDALHTDWLPVAVDGMLQGVVERSALTASMLLDVARQVRATGGK
jgi:CBS domain-containing protein